MYRRKNSVQYWRPRKLIRLAGFEQFKSCSRQIVQVNRGNEALRRLSIPGTTQSCKSPDVANLDRTLTDTGLTEKLVWGYLNNDVRGERNVH